MIADRPDSTRGSYRKKHRQSRSRAVYIPVFFIMLKRSSPPANHYPCLVLMYIDSIVVRRHVRQAYLSVGFKTYVVWQSLDIIAWWEKGRLRSWLEMLTKATVNLDRPSRSGRNR